MKKIETYIKEQLFNIKVESVKSTFTRKVHGFIAPFFIIHKKIFVGNYSPFSFASTIFVTTEYEIWESECMVKAIDYQESVFLSKCPNKRTTLYVYVSIKLKNGLNHLKAKYHVLRN